jgi:site-specific DNA-adenine methylase
VKVVERWATPHTAIYADPPYVGLEDYYAHNAKAGKDDSLDLHYRLASALNTVEAAAVIVSYYPCELVDELYPEETWERHYKETVASSAGITRQSKSRKRPRRTELLLVRKQPGKVKANLSGQISLF